MVSLSVFSFFQQPPREVSAEVMTFLMWYAPFFIDSCAVDKSAAFLGSRFLKGSALSFSPDEKIPSLP